MGADRRVFGTVEEAADALGRLWRADLVQMDAGPVRIDVRTAVWGRCAITSFATNRRLVSTGERSPDLLTVTPITVGNAAGRFRGRVFSPGTLLVLDPGGEAVQQVPAGHRQMALSVPLSLFRRVAEVEHLDAEGFLRWQPVKPASAAFSRLVRAIRDPFRSSGSTPMPRDDDDRLVDLVLGTLTGSANRVESLSADRRRSIARRAEEMIRADPASQPSVLDLCEGTGASRRALFYAFVEFYGVPPASFAKTLRLHAARQEIRTQADRGSVQRVARQFGFKHLGQFAIDYARAFGESPSVTWRRSTDGRVPRA